MTITMLHRMRFDRIDRSKSYPIVNPTSTLSIGYEMKAEWNGFTFFSLRCSTLPHSLGALKSSTTAWMVFCARATSFKRHPRNGMVFARRRRDCHRHWKEHVSASSSRTLCYKRRDLGACTGQSLCFVLRRDEKLASRVMDALRRLNPIGLSSTWSSLDLRPG